MSNADLLKEAEYYRVKAAKIDMQIQKEKLLLKLEQIEENINLQDAKLEELEEQLSKPKE